MIDLVVEIWFHADIDGERVTCACVLDAAPSPSDSRYSKTFKKRGGECGEWLPSDCLEVSLIYSARKDHVAVLIPAAYRGH